MSEITAIPNRGGKSIGHRRYTVQEIVNGVKVKDHPGVTLSFCVVQYRPSDRVLNAIVDLPVGKSLAVYSLHRKIAYFRTS